MTTPNTWLSSLPVYMTFKKLILTKPLFIPESTNKINQLTLDLGI